MRRLTIIDLSSILHAAKHSIGKTTKLSYNGQQTFIIFGFMMRLCRIAEKTNPDVLVFACDSKNSIRRDKYYHLYKDKRRDEHKTPDQQKLDQLSRPQFDIVKKIIPYIGYQNIFEFNGYEADDIIGVICKKYIKDDITIITSDEDMYQLLSPSVSIIKPKNYVSYTEQNFIDEFGHPPKMWKRVKVYGGCSSDGIPGLEIPNDDKTKKIRHIGPITAWKFINETLGMGTNTYKAFTQPKAKEQILRNKILTILPLIGTPDVTIQHDFDLSLEKFLKVVDKYGFKSIREDVEDYKRVLKLR